MCRGCEPFERGLNFNPPCHNSYVHGMITFIRLCCRGILSLSVFFPCYEEFDTAELFSYIQMFDLMNHQASHYMYGIVHTGNYPCCDQFVLSCMPKTKDWRMNPQQRPHNHTHSRSIHPPAATLINVSIS